MTRKQTVYILVGPKGSGKSYIGGVLEQEFHIRFLRVEPLLIDHIGKFGQPEGGLPRHGFDIEEKAIHVILSAAQAVIFEATGTSEYFPSVLDNLSTHYNVKLVRILCQLDTCFDRIKQRSTDGHFHVGDDAIKQINQQAVQVAFEWALEIDNSQPASRNQLISSFKEILVD